MELPNIQTLRSFVIYGRLGNFTLAAKEANVTQSAFSAQIKKLEIIVGVPLIRRDNKGEFPYGRGRNLLQRGDKDFECLGTSRCKYANYV